MSKYLVSIIILTCLVSCKQDPIRTDEIFTLGFEQSRTLESAIGNFDISFTDLVEDSRCPQGVVCVWAGRVLVEITINGDKMILGLGDLSAGEKHYAQKQEYEGYTYELIDVFFDEEKYRGLEKHYAISLKVSKN